MGNSIKYTTGSESNSLAKGNFRIGTGDVGKGASSVTGFYKATEPPSGGYRIYLYNDGLSGDIAYHTATNDSELISFTNNLVGTSYTTVQECLVYYSTQTDKVCFNREYEPIVTNGLVLNVDAGFVPSYPQSGTTWDDLSGNGYDGTLLNGPTYSSSNGGSIVFDGVDDRINFGNILNFGTSDPFSISVWFNNSKTLATTNDIYGLVNKYDINGVNGWTICLRGYSSGIMVRFSTSGTFGDVSLSNVTKAQMSDGNWHNITVTYNTNDLCSVYVDGSFKGIQTFTNYNFTNSVPLSIGSFNNSNVYLNQDKISTTQIYNKTLTATEVLQNYQAMFPRFLGENIVTSGMVLYLDAGYDASYPGSGTTWSDVSGYGNNGTLVNGPTFNSDNGGSIVFDGVDDYLDCGNILFNNQTTITIDIWVNIQAFRTNNSVISKGAQAEGSNSTFAAWIVSSTTSIRNRFFNNEGVSGFVTTPNNLSVNTWYNLTWTYDNTTITGYLNGVSYGAASLTGPLKTNTNPLRMARDIYGNNTPMTSSIIMIYNRALSQQEILQNYNAQKARFGL